MQKKHKTRVAFLREELEKEEMYVEYLDKLLADIERHRKHETRGGDNEAAAAVATTPFLHNEPKPNNITSSSVHPIPPINVSTCTQSTGAPSTVSSCTQ